MPQYVVTREDTVDAETPEVAAWMVYVRHRRAGSESHSKFIVTAENGHVTEIDTKGETHEH